MTKLTAIAATLLTASLLPAQAAEPANINLFGEVDIAGIAQVQDGQIWINGVAIHLTAQTQWDDIRVHDLSLLAGKWLQIEGQLQQDQITATEIELDNDHPTGPEKELLFGYDIELKGPVSNGQLWGYHSSDNSLQAYNGLWLELDCKINWPEPTLSQCHAD